MAYAFLLLLAVLAAWGDVRLQPAGAPAQPGAHRLG